MSAPNDDFGMYASSAQVAGAFVDKIAGKTILITGPSAGSIGAATATGLSLASPKLIILAGRTLSKIQPVLDELAASNTPSLFLQLDLTDQSSIRAAVASIPADVNVDILINCAGVMAMAKFSTIPAANGAVVEIQHGTNHISHFLLTNLLLRTHRINRIVNVSSTGYVCSPYLPQSPESYHPWKAYGSSKTANVLFTVSLAKRGVEAVAVHPGQPKTALTKDVGPEGWALVGELLAEATAKGVEPVTQEGDDKTLDQSGAVVVDAAVGPWEGKSGVFLRNRAEFEVPDYTKDEDEAERLWTESEELVGEKFELKV